MADNPEHMVAFSSRGPTQDGRVKPDVVAPGTFILSTRSTMIAPNNMAWAGFPPSRLYFHMGGTSMATPLTAGAVGIIREYVRTRQQIANPSAALLKATLIAGAGRLTGSPPGIFDHNQGFGRVNVDAILSPAAPVAARFIDQSPGLRTGEVYSMSFSIASRQAPLRVVLAYSDYPGPSLVNNLNLVLQSPDATRFVGNQAPGGGLTMDTTNNVEVAHIASPTPGAWTLQVIGSNIPSGPQDFALVLLGHLGEPLPAADNIEVMATPNLPIPDNSPAGVTSKVAVQRAGTVGALKVSVDIAHPYIGDLRVLLTAPDNQRITLHSRKGGSADNINTTYDPAQVPDLAHLIGIGAQGEWSLIVVDEAARDVGTLRSWKLSINLAESDPYRAASQPGMQIPDNNPAGVSDSVEIAGTGSVREVRVFVDITHTYIGDLRVVLRSPSGREVTLHNRAGGPSDNLLRTYDASTAPDLASLVGESTAGRWTLRVSDLAGRDVGKLNRWELHVLP
jgi:subtilisin-like proprotein convertase family protein